MYSFTKFYPAIPTALTVKGIRTLPAGKYIRMSHRLCVPVATMIINSQLKKVINNDSYYSFHSCESDKQTMQHIIHTLAT